MVTARPDEGGGGTEDYTVSFWYNRDGQNGTNANGTSTSGEAWIIGTDNGGPPTGGGSVPARGIHLGFTGSASGNLTQAHWSADHTGSTPVSASGWNYATFTFDADGGSDIIDPDTGGVIGQTGLASIYVNGVLDAQVDQNGVLGDEGTIVIGSRVNDAGPHYNGRIDDLAIFDSVLDATQVDTLFNDTTQALALGAGAYYNFEDDQTGTTAAVQGTGLGAIALTGITAVPEPSSLVILAGLGIAGLVRRKRS